MKNNINDFQLFLKQLQEDLIEDRINETTQASPIYYGIHDTQEIITAEGYDDDIMYYDDKTSSSYDNLIDFLQEENEIQTALDNNWIQSFEDEYDILDEDAIIENYNLEIKYLQNVPYICPDALFLTRKSAKQYLNANHYHYKKDACTYAMTATRNPQYENLLHILKQVDWENSYLKLRIPLDWITDEQLQQYLIGLTVFYHIKQANNFIENMKNTIYTTCEIRYDDNKKSFFNPTEIKTTIFKQHPDLKDIYVIPITKEMYDIITGKKSHNIQKQSYILSYYDEGPYYHMFLQTTKKGICATFFCRNQEIGSTYIIPNSNGCYTITVQNKYSFETTFSLCFLLKTN